MAGSKKTKIESCVEEILSYVDNCKFQPFSSEKIVVVKSELESLLYELQDNIPDEVKKYQKMLMGRDKIIRDAEERASIIERDAQAAASEKISQHEIMQEAYKHANDVVAEANQQAQMILDSATTDANSIRMSAMQYTDDCLANLQNIISYSMDEITDRYNAMMKSMSSALDIVNANRTELNQPEETPEDYDNIEVDVDGILDEVEE